MTHINCKKHGTNNKQNEIITIYVTNVQEIQIIFYILKWKRQVFSSFNIIYEFHKLKHIHKHNNVKHLNEKATENAASIPFVIFVLKLSIYN